jgi:hypothetical protein
LVSSPVAPVATVPSTGAASFGLRVLASEQSVEQLAAECALPEAHPIATRPDAAMARIREWTIPPL